MNRIYSIILLVSFLAGAVYPAAPMVEYFMTQIEICDIDPSESNSEDDCCQVCDKEMKRMDCNHCDSDQPDNLLDVEQYPTPIQLSGQLTIEMLPGASEKYIRHSESVISFYGHPGSPPPRYVTGV